MHRLDAAHLYRLALESAPAGTRLHGVGEEAIPVGDIASMIGRRLNLPITAISREEAQSHFTWLAPFVTLDVPASSTFTQKLVDWHPVHAGLISDLEKGHYFGD